MAPTRPRRKDGSGGLCDTLWEALERPLEHQLVADRDARVAGRRDRRLAAARDLDLPGAQLGEDEPMALVEAQGGQVVVRGDQVHALRPGPERGPRDGLDERA